MGAGALLVDAKAVLRTARKRRRDDSNML